MSVSQGTGGHRPFGRVSTSDAIAAELTRDILSGSIQAGTHLREIDLSEQFGVSRQSIRAALTNLEYQGLVVRMPHRGVMVPILTRSDALDIHRSRVLIEGDAFAHLATDLPGQALVEDAVNELERLPANSSWDAVTEGDALIHRAAVASVRSVRLTRMHNQVLSEIRLLIVPAQHFLSQSDLALEHRELLSVVALGHPEVARQRLVKHLEFGLEQLVASLPEKAEA